MSKAEMIAQHIPLLRRYARALAGSQDSGDAYVETTLQTLVADRSLLDDADDLRVALYRVFSQIWNSLDVNVAADRFRQHAAERNLGAITPLPRQAFLLTSVEGFNAADAAQILGIDVEELKQFIADAGAEIADQVATTALIIEDEPIIALDLEAIVNDLGHEVLGNARTHGEAVAMVKSRRPGLVLADIQLADGSSGVDAVNEMLEVFEVPVIFITAYPERLLTGTRPEPAFLITKPFDEMTVKAVISQALFFEHRARSGTI